MTALYTVTPKYKRPVQVYCVTAYLQMCAYVDVYHTIEVLLKKVNYNWQGKDKGKAGEGKDKGKEGGGKGEGKDKGKGEGKNKGKEGKGEVEGRGYAIDMEVIVSRQPIDVALPG